MRKLGVIACSQLATVLILSDLSSSPVSVVPMKSPEDSFLMVERPSVLSLAWCSFLYIRLLRRSIKARLHRRHFLLPGLPPLTLPLVLLLLLP